MIKLKVDLGPRSYPIFIGEGILEKLGEMGQIYGFGKKIVVITDTNVDRILGTEIRKSLKGVWPCFEIVTVARGERAKTLANAERIVTRMLELGCERSTAVIAIGGGVVGDLAGFVASVYKRGVPLIQVPTTLLAQVDASVGGKTAVNHRLGKNMIGTFHQPSLVWIDLSVLRTLPKREINCGLGEVIKYGIIEDADLFTLIEENLDNIFALEPSLMQEIVKRCCEIKSAVVSKDERDRGLRMILNFGHTVGHALEAALGYKRIAHGEAILLGMLAESKVALDLGLLGRGDWDRIQRLIEEFALADKLADLNVDEVIQFMLDDKKVLDDKLRLPLPSEIGRTEIVESLEHDLLRAGLAYLLRA